MDMTTSRLIGHYRYYSKALDGETIRALLEYEQLREKRSQQKSAEDKLEPPKCRMCRQPLSPESESKTGRPKEVTKNNNIDTGKELVIYSKPTKKGVPVVQVAFIKSQENIYGGTGNYSTVTSTVYEADEDIGQSLWLC